MIGSDCHQNKPSFFYSFLHHCMALNLVFEIREFSSLSDNTGASDAVQNNTETLSYSVSKYNFECMIFPYINLTLLKRKF